MSEHKDRVALRPGLMIDVHQRTTNALFGPQTAWWVEYEGAGCCDRLPIEQRHLYRDDAIAHGREIVSRGRWKAT